MIRSSSVGRPMKGLRGKPKTNQGKVKAVKAVKKPPKKARYVNGKLIVDR